jgi:pseudaminic acid biosynthesis-associated methylase
LAIWTGNIKVLEVGSNIGNQLLCLQKLGFENLCGIELQSLAVELSKSRTKGIDIIRGSAFDLPFRDLYFDMVFTSGLLIHISPEAIHGVLDEIFRCTRQYIWGLEYYSATYTEVMYRGHSGLLWKTDFPKLFLSRFPDLRLLRSKYLEYLNDDNIDVMYLLEKTNRRH